VEKTLIALAVNLAANARNAEAMASGENLNAFLNRLFQSKDPLLAKMLRNLSQHDGPVKIRLAEFVGDIAALARQTQNPDLLVELLVQPFPPSFPRFLSQQPRPPVPASAGAGGHGCAWAGESGRERRGLRKWTLLAWFLPTCSSFPSASFFITRRLHRSLRRRRRRGGGGVLPCVTGMVCVCGCVWGGAGNTGQHDYVRHRSKSCLLAHAHRL